VYDIDEFKGHPFIAVEYLDGQTLKHRIGVGPVLARFEGLCATRATTAPRIYVPPHSTVT